ncbi:MAG: hypothetical protein ACI9LO_002459 [Planctomycetota bacterium]|jgi:hypothetical protein
MEYDHDDDMSFALTPLPSLRSLRGPPDPQSNRACSLQDPGSEAGMTMLFPVIAPIAIDR